MQVAIRLCCGTWRSSSRFPQPRAENVALFTADSEYAAPGGCVQEVTWVRRVLQWIGVQVIAPTAVYADNDAPRIRTVGSTDQKIVTR